MSPVYRLSFLLKLSLKMCNLSILGEKKNLIKAEIIQFGNAAAMPHCNFDSNISHFHFLFMPGFLARLSLLCFMVCPRRAPGLHERCSLTESVNAQWKKRVHDEAKLNPIRIQGSASNRNTSSFSSNIFQLWDIFFFKQ